MVHPTQLPPLPTTPAIGSVWRHRKGGVYQVLYVARDEATLTPLVVYTPSVVPCTEQREYWVRPHAEFTDGRFMSLGQDA